jgi:hypothetical protein
MLDEHQSDNSNEKPLPSQPLHNSETIVIRRMLSGPAEDRCPERHTYGLIKTCAPHRRENCRESVLPSSSNMLLSKVMSSHTMAEPRFGNGRLEQLHRVAGWILNQALFSSHACNNVASETDTSITEALHHAFYVCHLNGKTIPPSRLGERAVRHLVSPTWPTARLAQYQAEIAPGQHGKSRCGMHDFMEIQSATIERDRSIHVVNDIPNLHCRH